MTNLKKQITCFYTDRIEYQTLDPIAQEALERGYEVIFSDNVRAKAEIGIYCQHECYPENAKLSVIMLHDMAQRHNIWPNIWRAEPWSKFDLAILPGDGWAERWRLCSWLPYTRPRKGVYALGWPKADLIYKNKEAFDAEVEKLRSGLDLKYDRTVLYAPSWENDAKQDEFVRALIDLPVNLILKQAPWPDNYPQILENIRRMNELHSGCACNVHIIDPQVSIMYCLGLADIIVSEESSVVVEALLLDVPSIAVTDWRIPDTDPPRLPIAPFDFVVKTTKSGLRKTVTEILSGIGTHRDRLSGIRAHYFSNQGKSAKAIVDLIDSNVDGKPFGTPAIEPKIPSFAGMGYHLDPDSAVWVAKNRKGFAYSDGDAEEKYIFNAIRGSHDVSCSSNELPAKIRDWPSEYHLSAARSNLMAPFLIKPGTTILELGCGMGAITRSLGETGAEVTAVEGSLQRSAIARERCRDLNNVQVVCDNFKNFQNDKKFDIVTLIGVMEYSPKFIGGNDPIGACLEIAKKFLKPEGAVIIAIENRLGLKYWNNCAEDHTGGMFDSIHDTYLPGTVATFGYEELNHVLSTAGFVSIDFLFPFPDYKLPTVILQGAFLGQKEITFAPIIGQPFSRDYSGQPYRHFSERLAWHTLERNGLIPHFSNSFICVCTMSTDAKPLVSKDWIVKIYNSYRSACFRTETTIYRNEASNAIQVRKERKYPYLPMHQGPLAFNEDIEKRYIRGVMLSDEILKSVLRHGSLDAFFEVLKEYKETVISLSKRLNPGIRAGYCPGDLIDCTLYNLIRTDDRSLHYIDDEWTTEDDVPLNFILLRAVVGEVTAKIRFLDNPSLFSQYSTLRDLAEAVFKAVGLRLLPEDIEYYCSHEAEIQVQVTGAPHMRSAWMEKFKADFSAPLNDALGVVTKLAVSDICKLLRDQLQVKEKQLQASQAAGRRNRNWVSDDSGTVTLTGNVSGDSAVREVRPNYVSIVILTFNELKYTRECIESIKKHTPELHEVIFVDNASTDGTVKWLRKIVQDNANYRLIENNKNLGFAKGCNQGIEASTGEYILLLNNDVVVTDNWLSGMLECLNSAPDAGIVGPMTNNISGPQKVQDVDYRTMNRMHDYAKLFRERYRYRRIPMRRIVGFCMLFSRQLVDKIGLLDESFGTGNFEDDDYCLRSTLADYRNIVAGDVFIHHYGSRSFIGNRIDYSASMSGNIKIFDEKWTGIAVDTPLGKKVTAFNFIEKADKLNQRGQLDKSIGMLIEGIKYAPDEKALYYHLAEMLLDDKLYKDALEAVNSMPHEAKDDLKRLEIIAYCTEELEAAGKYADRILEIDEEYAPAWNLKGIIARKQGDNAAAEGFFKQAIEADPGYGVTYTNRGMLKWESGQEEEALDLLEKGFILSPTATDSVTLYHSVITALEQFARAEKIFQDAKELQPENKRILFFLIDILIKQGKFEMAMHEVERAMLNIGIDDGMLPAALAIRDKVGIKEIRKAVKNKGTLSLCMIVKNEEKHLARCLLSAGPAVDEMIIVDTGSTDRTKDIARAYGAKVFDFAWTNDFSEARNYSLSNAVGDWVLVLDADEVIAPQDYLEFERIVKNKPLKPVAYTMVTRNYTNEVTSKGWTANDRKYLNEEAGTGWFPSSKVRLFVNDKRIRFQNPVHEFVEASLEKAGIEIKISAIPVHHYGRFDKDKIMEKGKKYFLLGKKKIEDMKGDIKALKELAIQACELGEYDASVDMWKEVIQLNRNDPEAFLNIGYAYLKLEKYQEALESSRRATELDPSMKEAALNYAGSEFLIGDIRKTVAVLETLLQKAPDYPPAVVLMAAAYYVQGEKEKGLGLFEKLRKRGFNWTDFLDEQARGAISLGRFDQAILLLEAAVKTRNINKDTDRLLEECQNKKDSRSA